MTEAENTIKRLKREAEELLDRVHDEDGLESWRVEFLGRRGKIPLFLRGIKDLPQSERKAIGAYANEVRGILEDAYSRAKQQIQGTVSAKQSVRLTGAEQSQASGHLHPLTLTLRRIQHIFSAMGFVTVEGPEVEEEVYNFDQLNIPLEHPARAETDTFYVQSSHRKSGLILRTHTSPVQVRAVLEQSLTPPFKILSPGRVFRAERTDATHETTFYQVEGLVVSEHVSIADFKGVIEAFYSTFFQQDVDIRLRPAYFPFVEPGFEIDISCVFCKRKGCRVCKHTGWVEVLGAGMVHPNVLKNMNIDPERYQGYAFGGAIDRITMLQHEIDDIRLFWEGNIRFLKQFS